MSLRALPLLAFLGCATAPQAPPGAAERPAVGGGEIVGDAMVVTAGASGFEALSREERLLAWHLTQAALASHPLALLQNYRHDQPIWELVEGLLSRPGALDPTFAAQLADYRRRLFLNRGVHDAGSEEKFVPPFGFEELLAEVGRASAAGARVPAEDELRELRAPIFDLDQDRFRVRKTPGPAGDPVAASAVNHYAPGIGIWDLVGFRDRYPRNSRVVREGPRLAERPYRAGGGGAPEGLGARELGGAIRHLEEAATLAGPEEREALSRLAAFLRSGEGSAADAFERAWIGLSPRVDWFLGFADQRSDPREVKGIWEGVVGVRDPAGDALLQALVRLAPSFEERMPWAAELRRSPEEMRSQAVSAVTLLAASGQALGAGLHGLTFPSDPRQRRRAGSRTVLAVPSNGAEERLWSERLVREFVLPEVAVEAVRCRRQVAFAVAAYHEVLGHASARISPRLKGDPRALLAPYGSALEEARAQAVALYHLGDPSTVVAGLLSDGGCQSVAVQLAAMELLTSLAAIPRGDAARGSRLRATLLLEGWLVDAGAVEIAVRGAFRYARVVDRDAWRAGLGSLAASLQRALATGDRKAAEDLVERYATRFDPSLRDEVLARLRRIGLPQRLVRLPPVLEPVRDAAGAVVDARARPASGVDDLVAAYERARQGE